ncbi:hypothetical protein [Aliiroseovarius sp. S253]|uniref:hypothetical protein n=1 Tax=Aliiroseovarius sp. S253 TaxID=3415133 RepID=UPI003C7D9759
MFSRTNQFREAMRTRRDRLRIAGIAVLVVSIVGVVLGVLMSSGLVFEIGLAAFFISIFVWDLFARDGASRILFALSNWMPGFAAYALTLEKWLETPVKGHSTGAQSDV